MLTTYFLKAVGEDIFKHQEMSTIPFDFYIALSSTTPLIDGTGVTEPSVNSGYARVAIDNSNLTFGTADASTGVISNHSSVYFPESIEEWSGITHYAIFDADSGGNLLMFGALNETMNVPIKTIVSIPVGTLKVSVANES